MDLITTVATIVPSILVFYVAMLISHNCLLYLIITFYFSLLKRYGKERDRLEGRIEELEKEMQKGSIIVTGKEIK